MRHEPMNDREWMGHMQLQLRRAQILVCAAIVFAAVAVVWF